MQPDHPSTSPSQPSSVRPPAGPAEPSKEASTYYTMREAAREVGCSESTLRRLVKADEVPYLQEETKTGFRYLFEASALTVIAHKAAMRKPGGRPSTRRVGGPPSQPSSNEGLQEASKIAAELAAMRVERDLLRTENGRLWAQVERLTESVTTLALPPSRPSPEEASEVPSEVRKSRWQAFWAWFSGRQGTPSRS